RAAVPLILVTARSEEEDKIRGFEVGADDYVTKPFSPRELAARIRAVLRRAGGMADERLVAGTLVLDPAAHRVSVDGEPVHLGPTEFRLLHHFMAHPERVYSRSQLLDAVWGRDAFIEERTVDVHVRRLRKALTPFGLAGRIETVRGVGYRFSGRA
ncbi:MAG: response regulator, partial [Gammaproteobacteria bacterium]